MKQELLLYILSFASCLAVLHVVLSLGRSRLPLSVFCGLGSAASAVAGLFLLRHLLIEAAERSLSAAILWPVLLLLGLLAVGFVGSLAWVGTFALLLQAVRGIRRVRSEGGSP